MKQFLINLATNFLRKNGRVVKTKVEIAEAQVQLDVTLAKLKAAYKVPEAVAFLKDKNYTVYPRKKR